MRYQDWDVLLFPEISGVPIQEFKTGCFVIQDPESASLQNAVTANLHYPTDHVIPIQLPVVTSYVPNLPAGTPFRVSVHSWAPPKLSRATENLCSTKEEVVFEARLFIDGQCVAGTYFAIDSPFPRVIEQVAEFDKNGEHEDLKFPQFHQAMLSQSWWNAGEALGRIKVVLAEGIARENRHPPFERIKNLVAFSFQHVPLAVLETSGIAWPNASMWQQATLPMHIAPSRKEASNDPEAHAHSPRRSKGAASVAKMIQGPPAPFPVQPFSGMPPPGLPFGQANFRNTQWAHGSAHNSVTVGADRYANSGWAGRLSSDDQSMPDYSHSATSGTSREVTDGSIVHSHDSNLSLHEGYTHSKSITLNDGSSDVQNTTTEAAGSRKDGTSGTFTLADNASRGSASSLALPLLHPSAAAKARHESYSQMITRKLSEAASGDVQLRHERETSDVSMKSRFSEEILERNAFSKSKVKSKPAGEVKGKKEGREKKESKDSSDVEIVQYVRKVTVPERTIDANREEAKATKASGDGSDSSNGAKRKRSQLLRSTTFSASENDPPSSSPSRKASRSDGRSGQTEYDSTTSCPSSDRETLGELLNV